MQIKYCEEHQIYHVAYMDPTLVTDWLVKTKSITTEEYIVKVFLGVPKEGLYIITFQL
jgi:hypothetical protein